MTITKLAKLNQLLTEMQSVVIAFSGGVDSTFLAAAAKKVLGDKVLAVTAYSETLPEWEREDATRFAKQLNIKHVTLVISELKSQEFVANTANRCYFCKKERFSVLEKWAAEEGYLWVLEGSNADDVDDYRPGMQAIAERPRVRSPLLEAGFTKQDIRDLSKTWGLPSWNKPSAACLSSRLAYGLAITPERLKQVEKAEAYIRKYCNGQIRVRHHGNLARIEVSATEMEKIIKQNTAIQIQKYFKELGFSFVTLDLVGYNTGSMNRVLSINELNNN
ncbi:MAG: ATP-dependent sacrificial sulfur transferase LarE [Pelosinus sp.]|nr:ATP-dependent sacrificial sulfur transferase LarE [Pelosinus sp.]